MVFSLIGKNPMAFGPHLLPLKTELHSVRMLHKTVKSPPRQIQCDDNGRVLWKTTSGAFWAPSAADWRFVARIESEIQQNTYNYPGTAIGKEATVLDCGANIGMFTRKALDLGAAKVVAFEPSPETAECFRRTFCTEIACGRVVLIEKGLWDREMNLFLDVRQKYNPASHYVLEVPTEAAVSISVTTLDNVVRELALPRVDFLKIDIEGSELKAIAGATETIRRFAPAIGIGTEHTDDILRNSRAVVELLRSICPRYDFVCTEVHAVRTATGGAALAPHALFLTVPRR